eukprot:scaffold143657_cov33-Prasinocladus_malaysianus.AAC.1
MRASAPGLGRHVQVVPRPWLQQLPGGLRVMQPLQAEHVAVVVSLHSQKAAERTTNIESRRNVILGVERHSHFEQFSS